MWLVWLWFVALQAWTRNSLNKLFFFIFVMSYLKRLEYAERNIIFCVGSTSTNLAWRDQVFSFFSSSKRGEKKHKTKKKNRLDFIHPRHVSRRENVFTPNFTAWKSSLICRNMISFTPRVKNSRMEWMGVEFEIHAVKTLIHAPWLWKKFTVFSEIHKPPFCMKGHKCNPCFPQSYHQKSINIQQSFRLGCHATLYRKRLISVVNRNLHKAVYKKEDFKRWDRRRSFSIRLVFIRQFWNRVRKRDSCSTWRKYYN